MLTATVLLYSCTLVTHTPLPIAPPSASRRSPLPSQFSRLRKWYGMEFKAVENEALTAGTDNTVAFTFPHTMRCGGRSTRDGHLRGGLHGATWRDVTPLPNGSGGGLHVANNVAGRPHSRTGL